MDTKTYIVARDEYFGLEGGMSKFDGTFRALLLDLMGLTEDEEWLETMTVRDLPVETLVQTFNDGNGDGQQYVTVWCVEDDKQVLG